MPRLFIAIDLPPVLRDEIHLVTTPLRDAAPDARWTPAARLHVTLRFLGACNDAAVPALAGMLAQVAARHVEMPMVLGGIGAFPSLRRPRVIWMGIDPDPRLELLQHDVEAGCAGLGYEGEGRPFRPHLTLARVREPADRGAVRALGPVADALAYAASTVVRSIDLMRSDPGPGGSVYTTLEHFPLRTH